MNLSSLVSLGVPPVVVVLFFWLWTRSKAIETKADDVAKDLARYKVEVAEKYATIGYLKDVEKRLIDILDKIERRLEK